MSDHPVSGSAPSPKGVVAAILVVLLLYIVAAAMGWPQLGTELSNGVGHDAAGHALPHDPGVTATARTNAGHFDADVEHGNMEPHPAVFMVLPFCLLLAAIAIFPLSHKTEHFWESNLNKLLVAGGLGLLTLAYYAFVYKAPLDRHFLGHAVIEQSTFWSLPWVIIQNSIFNDFVPFIILLFALYTICGGIRISGDLPAHPITNTAFLAVGALLASFIGTTGAAMLLIRPVLETNAERKKVAHTIVFFIFIVCNCGGCLLPIGDPPLFLGYLKGVDFLWTLQLWKQWALVNGALLAIYFVWDTFVAYPKEKLQDVRRDETQVRKLTFEGLWPNVLLLLGIVFAAALLSPSKLFPGTQWYPWLFLREAVQLGLVLLSLVLGSSRVREKNSFNYGAIVEVAALFIGIFICMQPALQILDIRGGELGVTSAAQYFWATGSLSSVLDNAPTYVVFYELAKIDPLHLSEQAAKLLAAISLGAVFMGANTYIGNGPNFMVKTIAEKSGIKMPSFFGYMAYSFGILIPLFVVITFIFFRG
ncbi:MAG: sodium:proton antiporter [Planctomycetia bacterium]|nr:sodium:proton antiporter [Planctomycetia bacterium]